MALHIVDHPLIRHKLGLLRKESTSTSEFRMLSKEVARLLTYEATKNLPTEKKTVKGWAGQVEVDYLAGKMITIVPILRAGLGLMDGVLDMVPGAKISVLGMYRNEETLEPVEYYKKLARRIDQRVAIILDPMLATGGSLIAAIDVLKKEGCKHICSLNLVAAPEGVKAVLDKHPDVEIYAAALDDHLNENGYIIPGSLATPATASSAPSSADSRRRCSHRPLVRPEGFALRAFFRRSKPRSSAPLPIHARRHRLPRRRRRGNPPFPAPRAFRGTRPRRCGKGGSLRPFPAQNSPATCARTLRQSRAFSAHAPAIPETRLFCGRSEAAARRRARG